jgi:hypothetical protein
MAKRNLQPTVPETPFMTTNNRNRNNATPIMTKGIVIQKALPPKAIVQGGLTFMRPQTAVAAANKNAIAEIPQFKKKPANGPPSLAGPGGPLGLKKGPMKMGLAGLGGLGKFGPSPMKSLAARVNAE